MKIVQLIMFTIISLMGRKVHAISNYWPYNNFTEGLTFAVSADKWTEFKNTNWMYFADMVMLMNLTDIEMGGNIGYMRENTYNVTTRAD